MKKNAKEKNFKKVCGKMLKWAFMGGWEYGRDGLKLSGPEAKMRVICLKRELALELKEAGILPL
jgi:hypothetical protein